MRPLIARSAKVVAGAALFALAGNVPASGANAAPADPGAAAEAASPTDPGPVYQTVTDKSGMLTLQSMGRPDGADMVFRISGSVYARGGNADLPDGTKLFNLEGFNVRRLYREPDTNKLYMISRELVFYTSLRDRKKPLTSWTNPIDKKTYPLIPINNTEVNFGPFPIDSSFKGPPLTVDDTTTKWTNDIPVEINFRQALGEDFGLPDGIYKAREHFDFKVSNSEVERRTVPGTIPTGPLAVTTQWNRTSPWAPSLCIAETKVAGGLRYEASGWTRGNYADIEPWLQDQVDAYGYSEYTASPERPGKSENSWTSFYNKQLGGGSKTWAQWCAENGK